MQVTPSETVSLATYSPEVRQQLCRYVVQLADTSLILGHRLSEWCGHGPILEQDLAMANIALDLLGETRSLYQYAAELEGQDLSIIGQAIKAKKGVVLMVNKWDLVEKDSKTADRWKKEINQRLAPIDYLPIIFASVTEKQRIFQVMEKAMEVYENKHKKVPTSKLTDAMQPEIEAYPPPATKGKHIKIKYMLQLPTPSPTFVFFCNLPQYIKESYERYLENKLRAHFDFDGVPLTLFFRKK